MLFKDPLQPIMPFKGILSDSIPLSTSAPTVSHGVAAFHGAKRRSRLLARWYWSPQAPLPILAAQSTRIYMLHLKHALSILGHECPCGRRLSLLHNRPKTLNPYPQTPKCFKTTLVVPLRINPKPQTLNRKP